jgi:hypothetical protein
MTRTLFSLLFFVCSTSSFAQDDSESLESVVVTGSRISYSDLQETPAVGIIKRADSVSLGFQLESDTRDFAAREKELTQTLKGLLKKAAGKFSVETLLNRELTMAEHQIEFDTGGKVDTSRAYLRLRAALGSSDEKSSAVVKEMRTLLEGAERIGRSEIKVDAETALTINKPERYRAEVLKAIADDVVMIRTTFGADCKIALENLNSRVQWQRVGTGELFLYVSYGISLSECAR